VNGEFIVTLRKPGFQGNGFPIAKFAAKLAVGYTLKLK